MRVELCALFLVSLAACAGGNDQRKPEEITAALRAMVGGRRRPPGTAVADPLADVLVHGQDMRCPSACRGPCLFRPR